MILLPNSAVLNVRQRPSKQGRRSEAGVPSRTSKLHYTSASVHRPAPHSAGSSPRMMVLSLLQDAMMRSVGWKIT
jgi:hypothetical protein